MGYLELTFVILIGMLMYVCGEMMRAMMFDFGEKAKGITHSLYNKVDEIDKNIDNERFDWGGAFFYIFVFFGTLNWALVYYEEIRKKEFDILEFGLIAICLVIEMVKIKVAFSIAGGLGVTVIYAMYGIGFLRGHLFNRKYQVEQRS